MPDSSDGKPKGLPLAIDAKAESASPSEPAFIARPAGAQVYHGFSVLEDVVVDGFTFGVITDFETEPSDVGDAFVIAPDGSRAGLIWEIGAVHSFNQCRGLEPERWGVWSVVFTHPMRTRDDAKQNLRSILPNLREKWSEWKQIYNRSSEK